VRTHKRILGYQALVFGVGALILNWIDAVGNLDGAWQIAQRAFTGIFLASLILLAIIWVAKL
jgi:hypothetical protein